MNKLIQEFAIDAFFDESADIPSDKKYTFSEEMMQKFAELIVEECAKIIEAQDVDPAFKLRMSYSIKKRFGVQ